MAQVDYKKKYQELKSKFMNAVDVSWRDGYEQGLKDSQFDQMNQQKEQDAAMQQASLQGQQQSGQEGASADQQEASDQQEQTPSEHPDGSELDQHIAKLESMLGKSEVPASDLQDLKKTLNEIKLYQGNLSLMKSLESIKKTSMRKPLYVAPRASANLDDNAKKSLHLQEKIVCDIMKSWEEEEKRASKDIKNILDIEGLSSKK